MTEQERDDLLLRISKRLDKIDDRLDKIETEMVTQDGLERFMKATFGEMLSDTRIEKGVEALQGQTTREPFVHRPTGAPSTRLPSPG